ncbi:organic cation transporter-like protein [Vanessa tameamea]|uniref:Organic cation transporter-like protein n=1 Tax=Vanessa tameamea TaxID=334116 RepID=A0ABM4AVN8_VANTA
MVCIVSITSSSLRRPQTDVDSSNVNQRSKTSKHRTISPRHTIPGVVIDIPPIPKNVTRPVSIRQLWNLVMNGFTRNRIALLLSFIWRAKIGSGLLLARFIVSDLCADYIQGQLSDRIGRKAAIIIPGLAAAIFGIAKSYATTYFCYIILEWFEATLGDNCSPTVILGGELVHSEHRLYQQIFFCVMTALGGVLFSLAAYLVPYWRHFVQLIYAPSLLFILYYFIMDESVRWLLSKGKKEKATLLLKMAKLNKISLDEKLLVNIRCEDNATNNYALRATFSSKTVIKRFLICLIGWTSCTFISFGLVVNVGSLAGNKYLNFGIMALSDIPASIAMLSILKRFKRKKPLLI